MARAKGWSENLGRAEKRIRSDRYRAKQSSLLTLAKYWMATANIRLNYILCEKRGREREKEHPLTGELGDRCARLEIGVRTRPDENHFAF